MSLNGREYMMDKYYVVKDYEELNSYIGDSKIIALDIETAPTKKYRHEERAALDPHKAYITGISFSVKQSTGVYVPLRHRNSNNADVGKIMLWIKEKILENKTVIKVVHNLAFESMFFYGEGISIQPPVYDTMLAAMMTLKSAAEFRTMADSGLKTIVPQLLKVDLPKYEDVVGDKSFDELPASEYDTVRYACADSDYALRLYYLINQWFDKYLPNHRSLIENMESPVAVFVGIMKYYGVAVDRGLMYEKQFEAENNIERIKHEILAFVGHDIEIGANASTEEFKRYLYNELKLPVLKTTAKYQAAADEESLVLLTDWCADNRPEVMPLLKYVHDYRKWNKIKSTYIDGFLNAVNSETGRIHCSLFQLGTDTGRFASRYPNLQNCPRKDKDVVGVRNFLVPSKNHVFVDFDFSQIELRVGAWYCRDKRMIETYMSGGDIHAQTTSVIYNIPFERAADKDAEHYKERRSIAKNCNFGVFYGLFPNGLMRNLKKAGIDKTKQECGEIIENLKAGYPGLSKWQEETKNTASNCGYSETAFGRRRILRGINSCEWGTRSYWERCALNTPIQGTAAEILKLAIVRILDGMKERPWLRPLLTIHDEILFEVPEDKKGEAVEFIKSCMEQKPFDAFDIPIVAEGAFGYRFGEMEEL